MCGSLQQLPRYSVSSLLKITAAAACLLAILNAIGPQKSWSVFIVCYAFAPTIAMLMLWLLRRHSDWFRYFVAGLTLLIRGLPVGGNRRCVGDALDAGKPSNSTKRA